MHVTAFNLTSVLKYWTDLHKTWRERNDLKGNPTAVGEPEVSNCCTF